MRTAYSTGVAAHIEITKLRLQGVRPAESISAYLRTLHRLLTVNEVAKILGHHAETIYRLIADGLPATKHGRRWRIDPVKLAAWIEAK